MIDNEVFFWKIGAGGHRRGGERGGEGGGGGGGFDSLVDGILWKSTDYQ
jgi:hypothetical protein